MTVSLVVWEKLKMEQDVEINVNKEKLALLEVSETVNGRKME